MIIYRKHEGDGRFIVSVLFPHMSRDISQLDLFAPEDENKGFIIDFPTRLKYEKSNIHYLFVLRFLGLGISFFKQTGY
jgi:hypothetical protein